MYRWIRPKIAVPVHGEARHLHAHQRLGAADGRAAGDADRERRRAPPGARHARVIDEVRVGRLVLETDGLVGAGDDMFRTRRRLMDHGTILVGLVLDDQGSVLATPQLTPLGAVELERFGELRAGVPATPITDAVEDLERSRPCKDDERVREAARAALRVRRSTCRGSGGRSSRCRSPGWAPRSLAAFEPEEETVPMIGRLNHVAIAVPDIAAAAGQYRDVLGADVSRRRGSARPRRADGVHRRCPTPRSSCWARSGEASPIAGLPRARTRRGGIHHVCYEVDDILAARDRLMAQGARVLGDGEPRTGAHGKPVLFLHPKDFNGTLVELEQA